MKTNDLLQQALNELAVAAAKLNESAIRLRRAFSDDVKKSEPVARALSERSEFIENASDKAFKETFVHPTMQEIPYRGHIIIEGHEKVLIHALRDVNADEITEVRANLDNSGDWRATLNAFLAKRRVP